MVLVISLSFVIFYILFCIYGYSYLLLFLSKHCGRPERWCKCLKKAGKSDPETPSHSVNTVITVLNSLNIDQALQPSQAGIIPQQSLGAHSSAAATSQCPKPVVVSIEENPNSTWSFSFSLELSLGDGTGILNNIYLNDSDLAAQLLGCQV